MALPQPSALPRIRANTRQKSPPLKVTTPAQSTRGRVSGRYSWSLSRVTATVSAPIGTFTKKIHSQPRLSVSAPPTSGPTATAAPIVAPQMPKADARSRPWNSWAIRAGAQANITAPPTPWKPRARLSTVGVPESPQSSDARLNRARPMAKTRRRPKRSASEPAVSSTEASISE